MTASDDLFGNADTATISDCGTWRYDLTRRWHATGPTVVWIMLNPSTADAQVDDPTIRRVVGFTRAWGAAAATVVNLFALRATNPAEIYRHPDPVGPDNDAHHAARAAFVVAAWGTHGHHLDRDKHVRRLIDGTQLLCLGTTRGGHPRHPLYVRAAQPLEVLA